MIAWCAKCDGPQDCDERGCIVCAVLREKIAPVRSALAKRRRNRLAANDVCINATAHGSPEPGKRKCTRCLEQHRRSNKR
jgi:hypothetical protein